VAVSTRNTGGKRSESCKIKKKKGILGGGSGGLAGAENHGTRVEESPSGGGKAKNQGMSPVSGPRRLKARLGGPGKSTRGSRDKLGKGTPLKGSHDANGAWGVSCRRK